MGIVQMSGVNATHYAKRIAVFFDCTICAKGYGVPLRILALITIGVVKSKQMPKFMSDCPV